MAVADVIVEALEGLDLAFPEVTAEKRKEILAARKQLGA
jgi:hypothetical protein